MGQKNYGTWPRGVLDSKKKTSFTWEGCVLPLEIEQNGSVGIVRVEGAINSSNSSKLQETLRSLLDEGSQAIILDVEELFYICSLGIGIIAKTRSELNERQGRLVLQNPREDIRKLLTMLRLDKIIAITDSREEALELCR